MLVIILAYLGGLLTIASPCILPVLPFVFARSDQPFARTGLPLLAGMAITFTLFATLAAVGGGWVVAANQYGRGVALVLMALFGITLLFPHIAERVMRPLVNIGKPARFKVTIDGQAPGSVHGSDVAPDGSGTVTEQRLYQLIRQSTGDGEHTFSIEFEDADVNAYAFTFG
ncbi:Cytochrome C biogenesis protein transmembrane region [Cedecea davisae]|uniref:DipZ thioredoxin-like C-terminal domain-containing protein n=1 Tax=Cedecea davisae DSM 4568 TaxID=566551 RepID=S3ITI8_9ENTR|nr:hypothetical protein [Cedecea davisae]EPF16290.1 hypothetical protein HMPREF0201_02647 [Cedecea davisae DSM 4568]SUX38927.1 Cytochrome C biogenesis protein transmembrane region [Cedecea davisae]